MGEANTKVKEKKAGTKPTGEERTLGTSAGLDDFSPEDLRAFLREMLLYRRFEEKCEEAYAIGKIGGFCHVHIGQEAVALGCIRPLRDDDYVISAYRDHTQALATGMSAREVMAELYGRKDGCAAGKGGSMHMFSVEKNFWGGHGIVGGQVPLATGMGWSIRYRGEDRVAICFMGDAAVNQGAFHESLNMAAVWKLPVVYIVENNEYGMGTQYDRVSSEEVHRRALSNGIEGHVVNGQDLLATYEATRELAERARSGEGPQFLEVRTYRFRGHSFADPVHGVYRTKEEVEERQEKEDPIVVLKTQMMEAGQLDQEAFEEMDREVLEEVEDAMEFADNSPFPTEEDLYTDVYAETDVHGRLFMDGRTSNG